MNIKFVKWKFDVWYGYFILINRNYTFTCLIMLEDVQYSLCQLFHYMFSIYVGSKLTERERDIYSLMA